MDAYHVERNCFYFRISLPENTLEQGLYLFGLVPARYSYPRWGLTHGLRFDYYLSFVTSIEH